MKKASYDTLLIVASNLTLAQVQATPTPDKPTAGTISPKKPDTFVWAIFENHLAKLQKQQETQE